jgi:protocatechuate 3,4-dioxygenase beta subunit
VDVWHSSTSGLYERRDPEQEDMNRRGKFTTDEAGTIQVQEHQTRRLPDSKLPPAPIR